MIVLLYKTGLGPVQRLSDPVSGESCGWTVSVLCWHSHLPSPGSLFSTAEAATIYKRMQKIEVEGKKMLAMSVAKIVTHVSCVPRIAGGTLACF